MRWDACTGRSFDSQLDVIHVAFMHVWPSPPSPHALTPGKQAWWAHIVIRVTCAPSIQRGSGMPVLTATHTAAPMGSSRGWKPALISMPLAPQVCPAAPASPSYHNPKRTAPAQSVPCITSLHHRTCRFQQRPEEAELKQHAPSRPRT